MCEIAPKVVIWSCPDLPTPVQEDKYLLQTSGNIFIFSEITPFHFVLANVLFWNKSYVFYQQIYVFF